ncbi:ATP-dependent Clp protease adaptor protein ClpS [Salmonella enterica subsp. enterica serovar Agona str. 0322]|nr:ATP-dependent Clp protease adaptor protein ClpS [Salmonella enterica subsp. enterica serovar Agona str. 0322]
MGKTNDWLDFDQLVEDSVRDALKPPSMYKVILVNDDYTPMEFVIDVLQKFFSYDVERATQLMLAVHYQGKAICGVFTAEVAETKVASGEQVCKGERASVAVYAGKSLNAGIKIGGGAYAQSRTGTQFKHGFRQSARAPS